jgi:hypothetical protein
MEGGRREGVTCAREEAEAMAMEAEEQRCGLPSPLPNCSAGRNPGLSSPGPDTGGATRGLAGRGGGGAG